MSHTRANSGAPGTGGIKTPNTRGLTVSNVTFVNFNSTGSSCLRACSHCKVFQGGFQVWFNGIKYLGQSDRNKVAFKWEHEVKTVCSWFQHLVRLLFHSTVIITFCCSVNTCCYLFALITQHLAYHFVNYYTGCLDK